jgi:hypothetical protein
MRRARAEIPIPTLAVHLATGRWLGFGRREAVLRETRRHPLEGEGM